MSYFTQRARRNVAISKAQIAKAAAPYAWAVLGGRAFHYGEDPTHCPRAMGTPEWAAWMAGWRAMYDRRFA